VKIIGNILSLAALITLLTISAANAADHGKAKKVKKDKEASNNFSHIVTVKESFVQDRYVYIHYEENGKEGWLATLQSFFSSKPEPGEKVEYIGGFHVKDFESKSQKRKFDDILFVTKIIALKDKDKFEKEKKKSGSTAIDKKHAALKKSSALEAPKPGSIKKINNGKNIAEIFSEMDRLNNKEVILRAKAMKVSRNILGKTWITFQDGTGKAPDNKVVVVTDGAAKAGDILTVKGILKTGVWRRLYLQGTYRRSQHNRIREKWIGRQGYRQGIHIEARHTCASAFCCLVFSFRYRGLFQNIPRTGSGLWLCHIDHLSGQRLAVYRNNMD
jgi:hypothetical protein